MRSCLSVCLCANQDGYITNAIHVETCNPARGIRIYAPDNSTGHSPWTFPSEKEPPPLEKYPPKIPHPNIRTFPKNIPGHFPREKQILSRSQLSVSTNGRHCLFIISLYISLRVLGLNCLLASFCSHVKYLQILSSEPAQAHVSLQYFGDGHHDHHFNKHPPLSFSHSFPSIHPSSINNIANWIWRSK